MKPPEKAKPGGLDQAFAGLLTKKNERNAESIAPRLAPSRQAALALTARFAKQHVVAVVRDDRVTIWRWAYMRTLTLDEAMQLLVRLERRASK